MRSQQVGFIGLGVMGSRMAARLAHAGVELTVWNRSPGRDEAVVAAGAQRGASPASVAERSQVVITMLTGDDAVEHVVLGPGGVAEGWGDDGGALLEMSTTSAAAMRKLENALGARDIALADAPVFGSTGAAEQGELITVVGAEAAHLERVRPLLDIMCKQVFHVGVPGAGATMKLAGNLIGAGMLTLLANAVALARASKLDPERLLEVLASTSLAAPTFAARGPKMLAGDYEPGWPLKHVVKDVDLARRAGEEVGLRLDALSGVRADLQSALDMGLGDADCVAVIEAVGRDGSA